MPALIIFSAGPSEEGRAPKKVDRLRVAADPEAVAQELSKSTGFVSFEQEAARGKSPGTVWINRDHVQMVRQV